ncbi:MAG: hypothetical protein O2983_04375 [Planctomycetota bacterium]|nr:hypothetical protein [Planctomycetota bacterium]MDA0920204.1 hypothetical protein [Planctomycetota bacterium]MDA1158825.1 hypothetical protein [Planctomycetota bacterium]
MLLRRSFELALTAAFALVLAGCTDGNSEFTEVSHDESEVAHDDHSGHGHGHHGPNGGEIVEVGNEEFHAEVVVDEGTHRIDVFVLGSDAKTAKPIDASEISLSFKHGDEVEDFKLTAAALDGEPEGQSSKFTLTSEELFEELHEHSEGATLSFTAGGESLSGTVTHSHDHGDDHGHAHGDDDAHHDAHSKGDEAGEDHKHDKDHDGDEPGEKTDPVDVTKAADAEDKPESDKPANE